MLSKEMLEQTVNAKVAELIVEQVIQRLQPQIQEQWDKVVFELVSTRKSNIQLGKAFNELIKSNNHIEAFIAKLQRQTQKTDELQKKEEQVLDFLIHELNIKSKV